MRSFNEFVSEKLELAESIKIELIEAVALRNKGISPSYDPTANPRAGEVILMKTGNKPNLYVIKKGSLFDGFELTPLSLYYKVINTNGPLPMNLAADLVKNTIKVQPDNLTGIKSFDRNLLTDYEKRLLDVSGLQATPVWTDDDKLVGLRQKAYDNRNRKEQERLLSQGVVTHKAPVVRGAEEDFMRQKLLGAAKSEPQETPEQMRRRIFGDDDVTPNAPDNTVDRVRQNMAQQTMRDLLAQRKAARDAGQVVPVSTRRSKPTF